MYVALKTLSTSILYTFKDGTVTRFTGKKKYHLANSWWDAKEQAERACKARGETFSEGRISYPE